MKKAILFAIILSVIGFTSCKKDFVCSCTVDGKTTDVPITGLRKPEATASCKQLELSTDENCKLK